MDQKKVQARTIAGEMSVSLTKQKLVIPPSPVLEIRAVQKITFHTEIKAREKGLLVNVQSRLNIAYIEAETQKEKCFGQDLFLKNFVLYEREYSWADYQVRSEAGSQLCFALASPEKIMVKPYIFLKISVLAREALPLEDLSYFDNAVHIYTDSEGRLTAPRIGTIRVEVD